MDEVSLFLDFTQRRCADDPGSCPLDPDDIGVVLHWLRQLRAEYEFSRRAFVDTLTRERDAQRATMAQSYRAAAKPASAEGSGNG